MGIATVVVSGKGGVGKSTISVGLATAFAKHKKKVLLVDCDAGLRSLDRMTGIEEKLLYDISDVVRGRCAPIEAIYQSECFPGVDVMPAPSKMEDMVPVSIMKRFVPILKTHYDHVILDCPAGVGENFKSAAISADRGIIVCNPDPVCVRNSAVAKDELLNLGIDKQRLIINRYNGKYFSEIQTLEDLDSVIDEVGVRLLGVVPEDRQITLSIFSGKQIPHNSSAMLAIGRIVGRLEGIKIPIEI